MSYLADRLARIEDVRAQMVHASESLRALYDGSDSWARLAPVLPGASLSGKRCTITITDWRATTEYSRPVLSARFEAVANGVSYSGSVSLSALRWSHGVELDVPRMAAGFTTWSGPSLTDSARRVLTELIEEHYSHLVTPDEVATWSAVSVAASEVLRMLGEMVRAGDAYKVRDALGAARDRVSYGCTVDQYDGLWFPVGPDGRRIGFGHHDRYGALKAGSALLAGGAS